eukprot:s1226_g12.t1
MNHFHFDGLPFQVPFEGMNEHGLTVSAHYLAQAVYEAPATDRDLLSALDVVPRLLANCSCVEEVIKLLESVKVVAPKLLVVGDSSPPSRFVRLFYLRGYALQSRAMTSFQEAVVLGTGLLNNVFLPVGPVAGNPREPGDGPELTDYGVLKSCQEKVMLIRGYVNSQWRKIDLKRLDFSKAHTWPLEDGSLGLQDITDAGAKGHLRLSKRSGAFWAFVVSEGIAAWPDLTLKTVSPAIGLCRNSDSCEELQGLAKKMQSSDWS